MLSQLDFSVLAPSLPFIWKGMLFSTYLTLVSVVVGTHNARAADGLPGRA